MSVPVAGRRKGQATTPSTASVPVTTAQSVPSWLDDAAPSAVPSLTSPFTASAQPSMSPALSVSNASPTVLSAAAGSTTPIWEAEESALPAFLRDDTSSSPLSTAQPMVPQRASPQTSFAPPTASSTAVYNASPAASNGDFQQKQTLFQELAALDGQVSEAAKNVEVLQGDRHAAAVEVAELDATLASLREKEREGQARKAERDARIQQEAKTAATSSPDSKADLEAAVTKYREECRQQWQQKLEAVSHDVQTQEETNAALEKECEVAMTTSPESRCQNIAFEALQHRLQDGARHLKQHFAHVCSSTVALSARDFLSAARQQRNDIFQCDIAHRTEQLQTYRRQREASMADFYKECAKTFQEHADVAFGALKSSMERRRRQTEYERQQRLTAFHAQLSSVTERCRTSLEQQLRACAEREVAIAAAQHESAKKELALRLDELARQRRTFQTRAEAEVCALRDSHAAPSGFSDFPEKDASFTQKSTATALPALHAEMDRVRTTLTNMVMTLRTKQQSAYAQPPRPTSSSSGIGSTTFGYSAFAAPSRAGEAFAQKVPRSKLSFDTAAAQWRESLLSLQRSRSQLQGTVAELKASSHAWGEEVHRGRSSLQQQRESVQLVRTDWESSIRRQLSTCLTSQSAEVPPVASLTSSTLGNVQTHVESLARKQGALRRRRSGFAVQMQAIVDAVHDQRLHTERLLSDVFASYEQLRQQSVQVEVDELTLRAMAAQVEALHQHVSQEAHRLATQKQTLDSLLQQLRAGKQITIPSFHRSPDQLTNGQSTQIFSGATSPLLDITNAARQYGNCEQPCDTAHTLDHPLFTAKVATAGVGATPTTFPPPLPASTTQGLPEAKLKHLSSATTRSLTTKSRLDAKGSGEVKPASQQSGRRATTTVSASSAAELFGSDSPSPIMPSLEGHSGWLQQYGGGGFGGGAYISVSPQTEETPVAAAAASPIADSEADFTTNLEPLDDDDEESQLDPRRSHS